MHETLPCEPAAVVQEWFERMWNRGDESAIDELISETSVAHGLPGGSITGREDFRPFAASFRSAIPDIRVEVLRCVTEGAYCAAHCRVTGTHSGDGLGFAPTGRGVSFEGMAIFRVESGQIQEAWNSFDFLSLYQQTGLIPATLAPAT